MVDLLRRLSDLADPSAHSASSEESFVSSVLFYVGRVPLFGNVVTLLGLSYRSIFRNPCVTTFIDFTRIA
jgi:hypothetical protein